MLSIPIILHTIVVIGCRDKGRVRMPGVDTVKACAKLPIAPAGNADLGRKSGPELTQTFRVIGEHCQDGVRLGDAFRSFVSSELVSKLVARHGI